jgi:hypothetical protein
MRTFSGSYQGMPSSMLFDPAMKSGADEAQRPRFPEDGTRLAVDHEPESSWHG